MDAIKHLDTGLLFFINGHHSGYFDQFMFLFSNKFVWLPFYFSVLLFIIFKHKKDALPVIVALVLTLILTDQISSGLIKDLVQRLRPTQRPDLLPHLHLINGYTGGKYGFVSSHAANTFGFAIITSVLFRNKLYAILIFLWAGITAYSRIYLGVHFPTDVLGGAIIGVSIGVVILWILEKKFSKTFGAFETSLQNKSIDYLPALTLITSIFSLAIYCTFIR